MLIALGMRFDDRVTGNLKTYAPKAKKIQVEIDPTEINKNVKVDVALIGDLREVLRELMPRLQRNRLQSSGAATLTDSRAIPPCATFRILPDSGHLYAAHVINDLWQETHGADTVVVTDVGQHQMWEAQYFKHESPRSLITSGGLGTMGFALPAAMGVKVARPEAEVWVVVGRRRFPDDHGGTRHHRPGKLESSHRHHQ